MFEPFLPDHMKNGMQMYLEHGIEPGSFLYAVLCNDLKGALSRADHINAAHLGNIVSYCYNEIPSDAWGSPEKVNRWLSKFREPQTSEAATIGIGLEQS